MKNLVVSFIWIALVLVLSSCSMESQFPEGHQVAPDNVEEKHQSV